ncbi:MAG: ATP-binding cassette domain-containing protein [Firmicutes bacterium]|nr:ATP-binding cassette domain-containing protein [Bacillota bacterium]
MENIIEVKGLRKSFKNNEVLKGVSFQVKRGQCFSLLGSNGAGKTTVVRILATLAAKDDGEVNVCGYDLQRQPNKVREVISLTGQYAAVDEMLTGRENLKLVAQLRHLKNYKQRMDELLELFELTASADKLVKTYSGGMRRKTDIAMSLLGDSEIIFLDEPTTGLDPQSRLKLWEMIKELKSQGKTIFLTTQYLEEAEALADYVAFLDGGVIALEGTINELKKSLEKEMASLQDVFLSVVTKGGQKK